LPISSRKRGEAVATPPYLMRMWDGIDGRKLGKNLLDAEEQQKERLVGCETSGLKYTRDIIRM
jgi:hypothetical protein